MQLTYQRMCFDGFFSVVDLPLVAIVFIRFLRTAAITQQL